MVYCVVYGDEALVPRPPRRFAMSLARPPAAGCGHGALSKHIVQNKAWAGWQDERPLCISRMRLLHGNQIGAAAQRACELPAGADPAWRQLSV